MKGRRKRNRERMQAIGLNIRHRRRHLDITQEELAFVTGMSQTMLSNFENGYNLPNTLQIVDIALALRTTVETLAKETGSRE